MVTPSKRLKVLMKKQSKLEHEAKMENKVSRIRDVSQWKLIRDREQVSEGESILSTIL
jgi:hypothetical protein